MKKRWSPEGNAMSVQFNPNTNARTLTYDYTTNETTCEFHGITVQGDWSYLPCADGGGSSSTPLSLAEPATVAA